MSNAPVVLLIGGLDGAETSVRAVEREVKDYGALAPNRRRFHLLAIPNANPERAALVFPPTGTAYRDHGESHRLWRWIGVEAPDLVLIAGPDAGLAAALNGEPAAGVGRIPARPLERLNRVKGTVPESEAHREMRRRLARTPRETAGELAQHYGHDFAQAVYIPAMALIGRLRLGATAEVEAIVAPYREGTRDSFAPRITSSHLSGHLLFAELAERTGKPEYAALARKAADQGFTSSGEMRESMPLHDEMSDSVFMGCPILARTGKLTGEPRYYQMALRHLRYMQKLCLRQDGLYRHSPLNDTAWGRGNAFPALGLALALTALPPDRPEFAEMLAAFRAHMGTLAKHQNEDGMWRQIVDREDAWPEFSATAMIGIAMLLGVRNGWLEGAAWQPRIDRAWRAVNTRTAGDGRVMDVCESTGKQKTAGDYLRRAAIFDRDPRGGGMALLFATEMAGLR